MKNIIVILMFGLAAAFAVQANQFQSQDAMSGMSGFNFQVGTGTGDLVSEPLNAGPEITYDEKTRLIRSWTQRGTTRRCTSYQRVDKFTTTCSNWQYQYRTCREYEQFRDTYIDGKIVGQVRYGEYISCTAYSY